MLAPPHSGNNAKSKDDLTGLSKEPRILRVLRKELPNIVKDVTPPPGTPHP